MRLEWITLIATAVAGYSAAPLLVVPLAALALMFESVWGKLYHLRRHPRVPLSPKMITYFVMGGVLSSIAAWLAYLAGASVRSLL